MVHELAFRFLWSIVAEWNALGRPEVGCKAECEGLGPLSRPIFAPPAANFRSVYSIMEHELELHGSAVTPTIANILPALMVLGANDHLHPFVKKALDDR